MAGSASVYSVGVVLCVAVLLKAWRRYRLRAGLPLPPGPTGLPLIGSVFELDASYPWLTYEQWAKQYGALVYANLLGKDFIIINSAEVAHDLLERRSTIYSERPYIPANELFGMDFNSGLLPYGSKWRLHRKMFNTTLNKETVCRYKPVVLSKARQLVENLLDVPDDLAMHCKTFSSATIMAATYGYDVAPKNDPLVAKVEYFIRLFSDALTPERTALLLAFPLLAHIPSWLPGGGYKQLAAECRTVATEVLNNPVEYVRENMASGKTKDSLVHALLETEKDDAYAEAVKAVGASSFLGGAETTDATLRIFILALVLHPGVQVKAREEIDRVVGSHRLPDFEDRPNLPYVEAVYREMFRWRPAVPYGLPHMTATSDIYEGMYIPQGAIVLTNIWAMAHNESRFDDTVAFMPDRHLTLDGELIDGSAPPSFGFGRRACPGKHFGDQTVWAAVATILATLDLAKPRDEFGNEVDLKVEFTSGISSSPKPFKCSITPRSACAEDLVRMRDGNTH